MKLKLKYFIRGFGIGIIFTAIVMSLSLQASRSRIVRENALTKEEIMEKAMGYGMVMESSADIDSKQEEPLQDESLQEGKNQENDPNVEDFQDVDGPKETDSEDTQASQIPEDNDNQNDTNSEVTKQEPTEGQDVSNEETNEADTKENETKKNNDLIVSIDYIPINITSGMTATSVGNLLKEKSIIEDSDEFRRYMSENGYSNKIRTGDYLIPVDATYKKIVDIITRKH